MKKKEDFITKIALFGLGIVESTAEGLKELTGEVMKKGRMKEPEAKAFVDNLISDVAGVKGSIENKIGSIEKRVKSSINKLAKDVEKATRTPSSKSRKKV
ncbi:MAG: hypothetical protein V1645_01370 [archaeon]